MKVKPEDFKISGSQTSKICGVKGLGETGITYVHEWLQSKICGYRKEFSNKYTEKGILNEDIAIDMVAEVHDLGFITKNTERKSNDWAEGECDICMKDSLRDIKCSWWEYSFPRFSEEAKNKTYIWQGQTYMWLWDKEKYFLDYCLTDAPEHIINREYWSKHRDLYIEGDEVDNDLYEEVRHKMIHSHMPVELRVKTFTWERDDNAIEIIKERVGLSREELIRILNGTKR